MILIIIMVSFFVCKQTKLLVSHFISSLFRAIDTVRNDFSDHSLLIRRKESNVKTFSDEKTTQTRKYRRLSTNSLTVQTLQQLIMNITKW